MKYLLGVDVGTTGTKALLFRQDGVLLGQAYQGYPTATPQVGWSEQDPRDWWNAVVKTVRAVCSDRKVTRNVAAISLSAQGGTVTAVDRNFEPLRPAMVWNDYRCVRQREAFAQTFGGEEAMYRKTGWTIGNNLPALEIRWIRDNQPEIFAKAYMFLTVADYISAKMTGIPAVDPSNAGINQLMNVQTGQYDQEILDFVGISQDRLAKILPSGQVIGNLTAEAAQQLGLTADTVLVSGAHDQYAVALGAGAVNSGDMLIGSGTCWVITGVTDRLDFSSGLSQSVSAVAGKYGSMCELSAGGVCLEWWRRQLSAHESGEPVSYERLNAEAAKRKAAEEGLFFYPTTGFSAPGVYTQRSSFVGLDLSHDGFAVARAIMEGVAFQIAWMMEQFAVKPSEQGIKLSGGASRSPLWCQLVADITQVPVRIPEVADMACVGAAILAGVGCGIYRDAEDGCRHMAVSEKVLRPDPEKATLCGELLEKYKKNAGILGGIRH